MTSQDEATSSQSKETVATPGTIEPVLSSSPVPAQQDADKTNPASDVPQGVLEPEAPPNPRLQALATKKANLEATLATLKAQRSALVAQARLPSGLAMPDSWSEEERTKSAMATANGVIKEHISLLHKYNEIKDIGQGLMGLIADKRGVRVAAVMEDYGMDEKD